MEELKTLKDLSYGLNKIPKSHCNPEELKQEAIKWIKYIHARIIKTQDRYGMGYPVKINGEEKLVSDWVSIMFWIKHFFNITDEELK